MHILQSDEIEQIKSANAVLLDVRTADELHEQSCHYAQHFDVQQLTMGQLPPIDKKTPIFVYCRSGNRSALAMQLLKKAGFNDVKNIGGISDIPAELCGEKENE